MEHLTPEVRFVRAVQLGTRLVKEGVLGEEKLHDFVLGLVHEARYYVKQPVAVMVCRINRNFSWKSRGKSLSTKNGALVIFGESDRGIKVWAVDPDIADKSYHVGGNLAVNSSAYSFLHNKPLEALSDVDGLETEWELLDSPSGVSVPEGVWVPAYKKAGIVGLLAVNEGVSVPSLEDDGEPLETTAGSMIALGVAQDMWVVGPHTASDYVDMSRYSVTKTTLLQRLDALFEARSAVDPSDAPTSAWKTFYDVATPLIDVTLRLKSAGVVPENEPLTTTEFIALQKAGLTEG